MGKIQLPPSPSLPATAGPSASADDDLDLPTYDEAAATPQLTGQQPYRDNPLAPPERDHTIPGEIPYLSARQNTRLSNAATLLPSFSLSTEALEAFLDREIRLPPRPCLIVSGTHSESRKSGNETKSETVTDFDFRIDLTRTLLRLCPNGEAAPDRNWSYTAVISDGDGLKAYRGTRCKTRKSKARIGRIALPERDGDAQSVVDGGEGERLMEIDADLENGEAMPGIRGWCERYCSDPASVKSFTYRRNLHGFNLEPMRKSLTDHIRATGYQGHISITHTLSNGQVTIYSPHWINNLRNNRFVYWACIILQLWILTWPVIWIMERRYDIVRSEWYSSRCVPDPTPENPARGKKIYAGGFDEATAAEMWAPVVREAAFQGRCNGEFLGGAEIEQLKRQGEERMQARNSEAGDLIARGQSALNIMGIRNIGGVNVTGAWGGDRSSASSSRFSIRMGRHPKWTKRPNRSSGMRLRTPSPPNPQKHNILLRTLLWTPPNCCYNPNAPPTFNIPLNILFAFAGTFTVANLYYAQPLLDLLAEYFHVSQERASLIPTCSQAGYAAGLIFICPMGDIVRRRPFVLLLTFVTATMWIGLCFTDEFGVFLALSFLTSITTVTPQIMLPLVGDLAPANRRATAISIVSSGLVLGLLFARLLSGIIASVSSWRNIYFLSLGLQYLIFILLWAFMPDYPRTNSDISYIRILISIFGLFSKHPVLVQATIMGVLCSSAFTGFWTTLTFLLSGDPYGYDTLTIGLFSIAGLTPMIFNPIYSRYVIDKYTTQFSISISLLVTMAGIAIGAYTGLHTVAGPILHAALLDFGLQATMIANRAAIYAVAPKARNRVNTGYMVGAFVGQLMGTAVGNRVYAQAGWVVSGSVSLGMVAVALLVGLARGPRENGWIGWSGGWVWRRAELVVPHSRPEGQRQGEEQRQQGEGV
ncbi:major facilitator superfamily domain-containing protein [Aspergillus carlsbadensis]|nr:major facilitator superfamily domain-containing protein [Aspergillus carlsbadensis]